MRLYDPAVVAVQLNLLGSHDAPRALTVLGGDVAALRQAFTLLMTLPGAPCLYYGDEIGLGGRLDPDCRCSYPSEPGAGDQALRGHVAALAAARHEHVALRRGEVRVVGAAGEAVVLERTADGQRALVAVNAGRAVQDVALDGIDSLGGRDEEGEAWRPLDGLVAPGAELSSPEREGAARVIRLPGQASGVWVGA
jgi:glycosidase